MYGSFMVQEVSGDDGRGNRFGVLRWRMAAFSSIAVDKQGKLHMDVQFGALAHGCVMRAAP